MLPCKHEEAITRQVPPTINLLTNLDELHPDILLQHSIQPVDYKAGLVFRSAIESIRGSFIASSTTGRQALIRDILDNLLQRGDIESYEQTSASERHDFVVAVRRSPDYFAALEVKGGEGNSINISERPLWAREFGVWCHLDGAIVNQPAHGAQAIVNRITNEMVRRQKQVDVLFFKDMLCGTRARPCPKYPRQPDTKGLLTAPDVFLFPKRLPSLEDPEPPVHTLDELRLPQLILDLFRVSATQRERHVWEVHVTVTQLSGDRFRRIVRVSHQGRLISELASRPWRSVR